MKITVNGEVKEVEEGLSVIALLEAIGMPALGIAVELNCEIVPKSQHISTLLEENDNLEIVKSQTPDRKTAKGAQHNRNA